MSTEEKLANYVRHTCGSIQSRFSFNLLINDKAFLTKSIFEEYFKKAVTSSYSWNCLFCKITTIKIDFL